MSQIEHLEDCKRIKELATRHGFKISIRDAESIWLERNKVFGVTISSATDGWLPLPPNETDLFNEILKPLHEWLVENGEDAPTPPPQPLPVAFITDPNDGPCSICAEWNKFAYAEDNRTPLCNECRKPIEGGSISSVIPHHYHLRPIHNGPIGKDGIHQTLCKECAIQLRLKVYPPGVKDRYGNPNPTAQQMRDYRG
jgi:hypothetical protein